METFSRWVIRYRWFLLATVLVTTAVFGWEIRNLESNYDYEAWLPVKDDVAELVREVDSEFSATMVMFVILDFGDRGVFHPGSLAQVQQVTEALQEMEGLFEVTSLLNIVDLKKIEDGVMVGDLIRDIPVTDAGMTDLKEYVLGQERYVDAIVSEDGRFTALIVHLDSDYDEPKVAEAVVHRVEGVVGETPCYFGGDPSVAHFIKQYTDQDFKRLVPAMLAVMVCVLGFGLRRVLGVVLAVSCVLIAIIWTFGLKAMLGFPFNMLSSAVAIMLIAIGSDFAVHIYNHYLRRRDIVLAMAEVTPPVVMSTLTTVMGLLTFSVTGIPNLKFFGIELAFGLGSACLVSVIVLPVFIYILKAKPGPVVPEAQAGEHIFSRALSSLGDRVYRHPRTVILITVILVAIMGAGITRISTNVDFVKLLPRESSPAQANEILAEHFGGMYANTIYFQGDLVDPSVLARQLYLENYLRSEDRLACFNSLNTYIAEENWLFTGIHAVPETQEGLAGLWLLLESEEMMDMIVSPERDRGLITAFIRGSETETIKGVSENIRVFFNQEVSDTVLKVDPERLPPAGADALRYLRLRDAARQLAWLAERYGGDDGYDPSPLHARLREALPTVEAETDFPNLLQETRRYLENDTVEVLPDDLVDSLMEYTRKNRRKDILRPEFRRALEQQILDSGIMDSDGADHAVEGLVQRAGFSLRLHRVNLLWESLAEVLPDDLPANEHYEKRAQGVLWSLLGSQPVFFAKQVASIPGIEQGVIDAQAVRIRQAGFPELIARLESVLFNSQYLSLILASLAVFIMVSVTQLSLRRGLASLFSVLVPLELVLGMMGWFGIPLDFGTVLNGALVIGLGIDGSIHFLHYYHHLRESNIERKEALQAAMGHVGRAVVTANFTTTAGFLILLFAHTSALRNFAFTAGMAILLVTVSVLTFLPAFVVLLGLDKDKNA